MPTFTIPVTEYSSLQSSPGPGTSLGSFHVTDYQLIVGMVRSILTSGSTRTARRFVASIARPTLEYMLDWSQAPALRLTRDFQTIFRDFSATSRIGELAQGVCYSYWLMERGYLWISDFDSWAVDTGVIIPTRNKKPDFVMFNPLSGDISVMEAKGTIGRKYAPGMGKALAQCRAVLPHVFAKRGLGCVLTLDANNMTGAGHIHLRDPEGDELISGRAKHSVFRRSYESWFEMSGDSERAAMLRKPLPENAWQKIPDQMNVLRGVSRSDPLRQAVARSLQMDPKTVWFSVEKEIWSALHNSRVFQKLNYGTLGKRLMRAAKMPSRDGSIRFPDGTAILPRAPL